MYISEIFSRKTISDLTSWMIPVKSARKAYRAFWMDGFEKARQRKLQKRYFKIANKLRTKSKIRVLFLVSEISKWKAQSLYDLMDKSERFEPVIAITILTGAHLGDDKTRNNAEEIYNYFAQKGMRVEYAYKNHEYIDLKELNPDIIFYQQPWSLDTIQNTRHMSKYALTFYVPYYVNNHTLLPMDYDKDFHKFLFRHYVLNKDWENLYRKESKRDNIYGLGHTMLDSIYLNKHKETNNDYVIYAPHHSFEHEFNQNKLNYGTFNKNGKEILEYAKKHPELNWVFKPHPKLKHTLLTIGVREEEIEEYWNGWRNIGIVCEDASYMDLFLDSKALITDCGSFLTEYFCTGKPLIHLIPQHTIETIDIAQKIFDTFYKVYNLDEMYETFDKVLIQNQDDKKEYRHKVLKESGLTDNYAAKNIMEDIEKVIGIIDNDNK